MNAHEHGNNRCPDKKVTIGYKVTRRSIEIAVIDQGGKIDTRFFPFVLQHQMGVHQRRGFLDFYKVSGKRRIGENRGTGTSFMYTYSDKVEDGVSDEGGLVVCLRKENPGHC